MNKHLEILLKRFDEENNIDFTYATERGDSEHYFVIFYSSYEIDALIDLAKEYTDNPELSEYDFEKEFNCELVYGDEYSTCDDCNHIIRTSPDSYHWQPDYFVGDGFIVCGDCFRHEEDYQNEYLKERINNPKNAVNGLMEDSQLEGLGFIKMNDDSFENGWRQGQNDNPEEIYDSLKNKFEEVLFVIDNVGQFDVGFSVWVRNSWED